MVGTMVGSAMLLAMIAAPEDDGYRLVWHDEFYTPGSPNPKNWDFERGFVRNRELQWYQPENAWQENGLLVIEGRSESKANPAYDPRAPIDRWQFSRKTAEYTSASLTTRGKHAWTYGRFEARGRFGITGGLWPAFWTLGSAREWPSGGEIDIMEFYRGTYLANLAWGTPQRWVPKWSSTRTPIEELARRSGYPDANAWAAEFHVYRMDWTPESVRLFVDDQLLNETKLSETVNTSPDGANPFKEPHYLILNLAIGGDSGGDPSGTRWPSRFEIDWVRVYQKG